jgi:hypothetical protein
VVKTPKKKPGETKQKRALKFDLDQNVTYQFQKYHAVGELLSTQH